MEIDASVKLKVWDSKKRKNVTQKACIFPSIFAQKFAMSFDARDAIILRKENNLSPDRKFPHDGMIHSKDNSQLRNTIYGSMTPVGNFANSVVKSARTARRESDASRFHYSRNRSLRRHWPLVEIPLENTTTIFFTATVLIKA